MDFLTDLKMQAALHGPERSYVVQLLLAQYLKISNSVYIGSEVTGSVVNGSVVVGSVLSGSDDLTQSFQFQLLLALFSWFSCSRFS